MKIVLLLFFFLNCNSLFADEFYFTVVSTSGLTFRKAPSLDSEKLDVLPFGSRVKYLDHNPEDRIEYDSVQGFWVKAEFENKVGYLFSGYLFPGDLNHNDIYKAKYLILDECAYTYDESDILNTSSYDPSREWYGIQIYDEKTIIQKIQIDYKLTAAVVQSYYNKRWWDLYENPIQIGISDQDTSNFYIGTNALLPDSIDSRVYTNTTQNRKGRFIFPGEKMETDVTKFSISGEVEARALEGFPDSMVVSYALCLFNRETHQIEYTFKKYPYKIYAQNVRYSCPELFWTGDLNKDNYPDIIIEENIMDDKCGGPWKTVYISEFDNGTVRYNPVLNRISPDSIE